MSNSSLVSYVRRSPNHSGPRTHKIDMVSIHCMAGDLSVETCGELFADSSRQASSNYGIGSDGRIALYVDEGNRSWCTSSASNDDRAVTIEVANIEAREPYRISDEAYGSLIKLLADICRRNEIPRLLWRGDPALLWQVDKQNMSVHRWFAAKSCPGQWLYEHQGQIAEAVNAELEGDDMIRWKTVKDVPAGYYRQQVERLMKEGVLKGKADGSIDLTEDMLRGFLLGERREEQMVEKLERKIDDLKLVIDELQRVVEQLLKS